MIKIVYVFIGVVLFLSCKNETQKALPTESSDYKRIYNDNFQGDTIQPFWREEETFSVIF